MCSTRRWGTSKPFCPDFGATPPVPWPLTSRHPMGTRKRKTRNSSRLKTTPPTPYSEFLSRMRRAGGSLPRGKSRSSPSHGRSWPFPTLRSLGTEQDLTYRASQRLRAYRTASTTMPCTCGTLWNLVFQWDLNTFPLFIVPTCLHGNCKRKHLPSSTLPPILT